MNEQIKINKVIETPGSFPIFALVGCTRVSAVASLLSYTKPTMYSGSKPTIRSRGVNTGLIANT